MWQIKDGKQGSVNIKKFSYLKRIEAILDTTTIKRGLDVIVKNNDFHSLKESYSKLKDSIMVSNKLTDDEASSLINYAIHKEIEENE